MRKILIVGEFNDETAEMNSFLAQNFDTQLCTDNGKIVESMLRIYAPDVIVINIDGFEVMHNEIFLAIAEYDSTLPVFTFGNERNKQHFISFYYSGQCKHVSGQKVPTDSLLTVLCKELDIDESMLTREPILSELRHILVVDDNPVLLRNMKNMLQDKYRISLATSAAQCMKILGQDKPDLIILDYEMPVVDGKQTLEMIRAEADYANTPVVFLTGVADKSHVDAVLDLHPAGYFVKPPMQTKMIQAIEDIFNKENFA